MILTLIRRLILVCACWLILSCTRNSIQFGDDPESSYTNIVFTDTISVRLSTVITDSFQTNGATSFLVGKYEDPYLGIVSAKNFFQMTIPSETTDIPSTAQYDSISFIIHPDDYYYGDTSLSQTLYVNELAETITYNYNNMLYNTSNVPVKSIPLGLRTFHIRPSADDSIEIRLNDTKGQELFSKLQQSSTDVTNADNFLNYFKGISLTTANNDITAVYGLQGSAGSMLMRVYYHTTIPYPEKKYVEFKSLANDLAFNQVLANRSGTGIVSGGSGITEISSSQTNNHAFLQPGTGLHLKMIFPTLRSIITTDKVVKLLKAELIVRPATSSFDTKYKLPSQLFLTQTNESNISGAEVLDSTGNSILYASPVVDNLYGENNYYRFNITSYISQMLETAGSEDDGYYLMHNTSPSDMNVSRLIVNNSFYASQGTKLLLTMIIINK